mgnify:CR=1 FL=1
MNALRTETKNLGPGELNRVTAVPVTTETRNTNAPASVKIAPARGKKLFRDSAGLFGFVTDIAGGNGDTVLGEKLFGLVFVNIHFKKYILLN